MLFQDRHDAGQRLAEQLPQYRGTDAIVLGLPRGGVVVAYEVARALDLPLDVAIVRKIGAPGNPEYAIGAIAENGELSLNEEEIEAYGIPRTYVDREMARQQQEIAGRKQRYRDGRGLPPLRDRTAIVIDDGVATGFTTATALKAVRKEHPRRIVLAVPVAPRETLGWLASLADEVVCLDTPEPFLAVGRFYVDFSQVGDDEVRRLLDAGQQRQREAGGH